MLKNLLFTKSFLIVIKKLELLFSLDPDCGSQKDKTFDVVFIELAEKALYQINIISFQKVLSVWKWYFKQRILKMRSNVLKSNVRCINGKNFLVLNYYIANTNLIFMIEVWYLRWYMANNMMSLFSELCVNNFFM